MSIQPGDIHFSAERINALDFVHRIERDSETQEFGQKNQQQGRKKKKTPALVEDETPHDVIEVSSDYASPDKGAPKVTSKRPAISASPLASDKPPKKLAPPPAAQTLDRHIDIKV